MVVPYSIAPARSNKLGREQLKKNAIQKLSAFKRRKNRLLRRLKRRKNKG